MNKIVTRKPAWLASIMPTLLAMLMLCTPCSAQVSEDTDDSAAEYAEDFNGVNGYTTNWHYDRESGRLIPDVINKNGGMLPDVYVYGTSPTTNNITVPEVTITTSTIDTNWIITTYTDDTSTTKSDYGTSSGGGLSLGIGNSEVDMEDNSSDFCLDDTEDGQTLPADEDVNNNSNTGDNDSDDGGTTIGGGDGDGVKGDNLTQDDLKKYKMSVKNMPFTYPTVQTTHKDPETNKEVHNKDCSSTQLARIIATDRGTVTDAEITKIRDEINNLYRGTFGHDLQAEGVKPACFGFFMYTVADKYGYTLTSITTSEITNKIDAGERVVSAQNVDTEENKENKKNEDELHFMQISGYNNSDSKYSVSDPMWPHQHAYNKSDYEKNISNGTLYSLKKNK